MRPRDAQRLLTLLGDFAPNVRLRPGSRDLAHEVHAALMKSGRADLARDLLDVEIRAKALQLDLKDEAWDEHDLNVKLGDRVVHVILEENHGARCGDMSVDFPGDRVVPGTWSVKVASGTEGEPAVLRVDIPSISHSDVAAIAQALVEECPDIGADTYQYP